MATDYGSYSWPGSISSNPSVGTNGSTAPTQSTQVAGEDPSGNLAPLQLNSSGELLVSLTSTVPDPLPVTDAAAEASLASIDGKVATAANQTTEIGHLATIDTSTATTATDLGNVISGSSSFHVMDLDAETALASIDAKTPDLGQMTMADSVPVAIASDQSDVPVSVASLPLPSGAATAANQTNGSQKTQIVDGSGNVIASTANALDVSAAQSGTWNINNISGTVSLPTGASTSALQTQISGQLPATLGQKAMSASLAVAIASDQSTIPFNPTGYSKSNTPTYNDYTSSPVSTSAYTQLVASLSSSVKQLYIFDSSGQAMIIATGAAASEVDQIYVPPGGGVFSLFITSGTRVSIKAKTATANSGYLLVNYLG